jgi:hypothetical protein
MSLKILEDCFQNKGDMIVSLSTTWNAKWSDPSRTTQVKLELSKDPSYLVYDICKLRKDPTYDGLDGFKGKYPEPHPEIFKGRYLPRIVNSDPLSEATVELVKDWLICCRGHHDCKEQKSRPLPTRVIDVRTENPKIIESEGLVGLSRGYVLDDYTKYFRAEDLGS